MAFGPTANKLCSGRRPKEGHKGKEGRTGITFRPCQRVEEEGDDDDRGGCLSSVSSSRIWVCWEISQIRIIPSPILPSFIGVRKGKTVPPTSSVLFPPCANCFLCWKKQSRTGEGKSLVTLFMFSFYAKTSITIT